MQIGGFQGISLIDYPEKISSIVFFLGCNMRCPWCQNKDLVLGNLSLKEEEVLKKLLERKGFIDGVVISGGEPTIHNNIISFCKKLKEIGFFVKVDTNGYLPDRIKELVSIVDYIAMDIKGGFSLYSKVCGVDVDIERIKESIEILKNSSIAYEFRTTCVPIFIDEESIKEIVENIKGVKKYVLQQYRNRNTLNPSFENFLPYSSEKIKEFANIARISIPNVEVRGG